VTETAPHQAIYRRWRAQRFAEIVGQGAVVETLRNAVRTGRVSHAILFVGPRGTGKTSLARILAKAVNCTDLRDGDPCDTCPSCVAIREGRAMDLVEIDAASNRGIDAIRELRERINYAPTDLRRKVYILDEAHQITKDAWNALLKSLEEPPDFVIFMFASTHPQDFPPAILSRLQRFDVRRLTTSEIEGKLRRILDADGREAEVDAIHLIARLAGGGMRDAESMLDQLLSSSSGRLDAERVRDLLGLASGEAIAGFIDALVAGDVAAGVRILDDLEDRGRDLRGFLDQVVEAIRGAIVGGPAGATTGPVAGSLAWPVPAVTAIARALASIDPNRVGIGGLRLQLELALFRAAAPVASALASVSPLASVSAPTPVPPAAARTASPPADPIADTAPPEERPRRAGRAASPAPDPTPADPTPAAATPAAATRPTTPTPSAAEPPLSGPAVAGDLAILRDRWPEIVARISAHPPTKPLIVACRPISVEDGIVTLGFPEDKAFLGQVADRRRPTLEEGIGAVLGRPVAVRCIATNLDLVPALPSDDEAAFVLAEARRIFGDDDADATAVS